MKIRNVIVLLISRIKIYIVVLVYVYLFVSLGAKQNTRSNYLLHSKGREKNFNLSSNSINSY